MQKIQSLLDDANVIGQNLDFMDEVNLWFMFTENNNMLVCFNFIAEEHVYGKLRSLCMKHGSGDRGKGHEKEEKFYAFEIPAKSSKDCYEELKRNSV